MTPEERVDLLTHEELKREYLATRRINTKVRELLQQRYREMKESRDAARNAYLGAVAANGGPLIAAVEDLRAEVQSLKHALDTITEEWAPALRDELVRIVLEGKDEHKARNRGVKMFVKEGCQECADSICDECDSRRHRRCPYCGALRTLVQFERSNERYWSCHRCQTMSPCKEES